MSIAVAILAVLAWSDQRSQGRSFEVEVTVDEGPLGIGLVPMPGGVLGA